MVSLELSSDHRTTGFREELMSPGLAFSDAEKFRLGLVCRRWGRVPGTLAT